VEGEEEVEGVDEENEKKGCMKLRFNLVCYTFCLQ
jgi:hypothetical protein